MKLKRLISVLLLLAMLLSCLPFSALAVETEHQTWAMCRLLKSQELWMWTAPPSQ